MNCNVHSLGIFGLECFLVEVECDISRGMPSFDIVGLPDASVRESKDRIRSALINNGFEFPSGKIVINLAPADIKKEGAIYDLPMLISILQASEQINVPLKNCAFLGELSLSGDVRPIRGILPMALQAQEENLSNLYIPYKNAAEGSMVDKINVYPVKNISQLINHLTGKKHIEKLVAPELNFENKFSLLDFSSVKGQFEVKRALEIAAAGGHNILLIGPPGCGKSMLAKRLPSILPNMTKEEAFETTKIHSIAGLLDYKNALITERPFRSPHHTISGAGLAGGGTIPKPGEISLAHNGVLFLDELAEFSRSATETLRQPLEDGVLTISRVRGSVTYPCSIMLVAAMNPCPCGYLGHPTRKCICSEKAILKYLSKISGPLLDRIDIHVEVPCVEFNDLASYKEGEPSKKIKERVNAARKIQLDRYKGTNITCNSKIPPELLNSICVCTKNASDLLQKSFDTMGLSARAYSKILKVSRTIADLAQSKEIKSSHIAEAIQYRNLDRKYWSHNV